MPRRFVLLLMAVVPAFAPAIGPASAQIAPSQAEVAAYPLLLKSAAVGDLAGIATALSGGAAAEQRDGHGRTAFLVAAHAGQRDAMAALVAAGADPNALDSQAYDAVTIAAVANDVETLRKAIELGNSAANITSPYDGTALIAAAHLGHAEVVKVLIEAGAPLDHVNNLGWTALIEAVVLGDGGPAHQATVAALLKAGADRSVTDRAGLTPLQLAERRGYAAIAEMLRN